MLNTLIALSAVAFPGADVTPSVSMVSVLQNRSNSTSRSQSWQVRQIPDSFMSANLPSALQKMQIPVTDASGRVTKSFWHGAKVGDVLVIFSYSAYKSGVKVEVKEALAGGIRTLQGTKGVSKLEVDRKAVTVNGVPGFKAMVQYHFDGDPMVYTTLILGKQNRLWQVSANYVSDPQSNAAVDRVFSSVSVKG
jgi:hypothetical protein